MKPFCIIFAALLTFWPVLSSSAGEPVVRAILFHSPTCPHCNKVIEEDLPPLLAQYGDQLQIAEVNVLEPEGRALYSAAISRFRVPPDRVGVPALVVSDQVLVGSFEIPNRFPGLIAEGLKAGGIDWPDLPGFKPPAGASSGALSSSRMSLRQRLALDPAGNALAIAVLGGMIAVVARVGFQTPSRVRLALPSPATENWQTWAVPALAIVGVAIAAYLSYVAITDVSAVCGPVGNCNAVQQSPHARLGGVLPVGILGAFGYVAILGAWAVGHWGQGRKGARGRVALLALTGCGVLCSIYLTFLEPFVIGASCLWCLTSAVLMTGLLWLAWPPGLAAWLTLRPSPSRRARRRRARP